MNQKCTEHIATQNYMTKAVVRRLEHVEASFRAEIDKLVKKIALIESELDRINEVAGGFSDKTAKLEARVRDLEQMGGHVDLLETRMKLYAARLVSMEQQREEDRRKIDDLEEVLGRPQYAAEAGIDGFLKNVVTELGFARDALRIAYNTFVFAEGLLRRTRPGL